VLAAAAAQSSQSAVTDADGSRSCVNRVTVADRDFDLSRSLYTWGNACKPQHFLKIFRRVGWWTMLTLQTV